MRIHFHQMRDRYGIVCKEVSIPNHPKTDEELVSLYESQITTKTKMIMVCHMVNITGQILPIRKICDMAHKYGVELNHTGTHPVHTDLTINDSIAYLEMIGLERKEKRLRFIQRYWSDKLRDVDNVVVNTPVASHRSCGIANVGLKNIEPKDLAKTLLDEFQIWTVGIDYENVKGCRITPNVYTTIEELDTFVNAIKTLAQRT